MGKVSTIDKEYWESSVTSFMRLEERCEIKVGKVH